MLDIFSYILGFSKGKKAGKSEGEGHVILDGDRYNFTDSNDDGHIVITEVNN